MSNDTLKISLEVSKNNEGTDAPWWMVIDPNRIKEIIEGAAEHGETLDNDRVINAIAFSIEGPYFSREEAQDYLKSRHYAYSKAAIVWCGSGYRAQQYRQAIRTAREENSPKYVCAEKTDENS